MENILLPSKLSFEPGRHENEKNMIVEPCFHGYGTTLGNALRRVLLSSLIGSAVTSVKIKGVSHEFQAIENVKEDALQIILNLKQLRLRVYSDEPVTLTLKASGTGAVTAAQIEENSDVEVVNKDLHIATITGDKTELEIEMRAQRGRGFDPTEDRDNAALELGVIAIDAMYSPVRNVSYKVEPTRVGDVTNFDKLILTVETDGSVTPEEAVKDATRLLMENFSIISEKLGGGAEEPAS